MVGQELQGLEVGNGVVQPGAVQASVEEKLPVSQGQSPADSQHGVGIVLLHREHAGAHGSKAQRVEVSKDFIWGDSQLFRVPKTAVGGDDIIPGFQRTGQRIEFGGAEDDAGHGSTSLFPISYHIPSQRKRGVAVNSS